MKTSFLPGACAILVTAFGLSAHASPSMNGKACATLGTDLQKQQAKALELVGERDALVDQVETAGDVWESAEAMRNFSPEQAVEADETKATYEALKSDLYTVEDRLQGLVTAVNSGVSEYNTKCVSE